MKKGVTLLLILAHITAVFHFTVPYLSYYANFTYFATETCINKYNPEISCHGSCQLDKMMHQDHQNDKRIPAHKTNYTLKMDFFLDDETPFVADNFCHSRLYITLIDFLHVRWQPEPPSPPPRRA